MKLAPFSTTLSSTSRTRPSTTRFWAVAIIGVLTTFVSLLAQAPAPVNAAVAQAPACTSNDMCNPSNNEFCDLSRGTGVCALTMCSVKTGSLECSRYNETTYCDASSKCVPRLPEGAICPANLQTGQLRIDRNYNQPCQDGFMCDPFKNKCVSALSFIDSHKGLVIGLGIGGGLLLVAIFWGCCCCRKNKNRYSRSGVFGIGARGGDANVAKPANGGAYPPAYPQPAP
ncbi:hypothetical protein AMAG_16958 [Allomyces macrogynus ATCC 38327]|uniref:Uncharacterized protein n=1 Tax=Allomyces macrogynus (strain ATCC 38327) TaxID=578462 RepID=A0A0L0TD65_ALLM3|nr:hypothetical protein AMAG_16958 [Allomyces macrogynus ATCC 38327]|eukprot:KNE72853.1 hypothetical protein AMAG_16958 [Allomyces macrogynus ATCC 38327]